VACHQFTFLERFDFTSMPSRGGLLVNSLYGPDEIWDKLRRSPERHHREETQFYTIIAYEVAERPAWAAV